MSNFNETKAKQFLLLTEPHRMFFALGSFISVVVISWWIHYQYLVKLGAPYPILTFPPGIHMYSLVYGMATYFILGFILTVFPRWLNYPAISINRIVFIFTCFSLGIVIFLGGLFWGSVWFLIGSALNALGFGLVWFTLLHGLITHEHPDKFQPTMALLGVSGGVLGSVCYVLYLWDRNPLYYQISYGVGIYFFLSVVIYSVIYRMVPFFTKSVTPGYEIVRYPYVLQGWVGLSLLKAIFFVGSLPEWYFVADGGLLILTVWQFQAWRFFMKKNIMLLKMLYISIAWFPIANVLFLSYGIYIYMTGTINPFYEEAALHALTIGCFGSIIMAMATRVSLGHSGRKLHSGRFIDILFWFMQASAITRVLSGVYSVYDPTFQIHNYHAAYFWLVAFLPWAYRFLPIYFRPRVDGK